MAHIWPIGGGKGGTGKSFLTANIGILLAKQRFKTLVIDADLGAPNLHTLVGLAHPALSLSHFLSKRVATLQETVLEIPIPNLFLISGAGNELDVANLAHERKMKMLHGICGLDYDYILLDLGAGTSFNTIDFFTLSDLGIFVCTPEPTSIENIYRLIRSVYVRKIRQVLKIHRFRALATEAEARNQDAVIQSPEYLLEVLKDLNPEEGSILENSLKSFQFKLVVNQMRRGDNPKLGVLICRIIERHLGLKIQFIGNVSYDENVHEAVCRRESFVDQYRYSQATLDLKTVVKGIVAMTEEQAAALKPATFI